jgi:hypothetical protein
VCCSLWRINQLFLFSGPSGDNFRVIPHLPTALGIGISSFRQRGAFVKGKVQDVRVCQKKVWNEWYSLFFSFQEFCAPRESWIGDVDYDCMEGVARETGNEALSSSLRAISSVILYTVYIHPGFICNGQVFNFCEDAYMFPVSPHSTVLEKQLTRNRNTNDFSPCATKRIHVRSPVES